MNKSPVLPVQFSGQYTKKLLDILRSHAITIDMLENHLKESETLKQEVLDLKQEIESLKSKDTNREEQISALSARVESLENPSTSEV